MAANLTFKQEKFVQELIKGNSQREAYKIAYNASKMTDKTIDERASRLFNQYKVKTRYGHIKTRLIKESEDECIVTAKQIIGELVSIALDDIGNYLDFSTKEVTLTDHDGDTYTDTRIVIDIKDSKTIDTRNISEVSQGKEGQFKFKLYDRATALYRLAEILGLNEMQKAKQKLAEDKFQEDKNINTKKIW